MLAPPSALCLCRQAVFCALLPWGPAACWMGQGSLAISEALPRTSAVRFPGNHLAAGLSWPVSELTCLQVPHCWLSWDISADGAFPGLCSMGCTLLMRSHYCRARPLLWSVSPASSRGHQGPWGSHTCRFPPIPSPLLGPSHPFWGLTTLHRTFTHTDTHTCTCTTSGHSLRPCSSSSLLCTPLYLFLQAYPAP